MAFSEIGGEIFILVLYRNNELRLWSVDNLQTVASINCSTELGQDSAAQGREYKTLLRFSL